MTAAARLQIILKYYEGQAAFRRTADSFGSSKDGKRDRAGNNGSGSVESSPEEPERKYNRRE